MLPFNQRQVLGKTTFTYSPVEQAVDKKRLKMLLQNKQTLSKL